VRHAIGAGVLGPVYRAHEADADRDVAVKLFRLDLPPERVHELVAQLQKLVALGVSHPSLVAPVEAGISGTLAYLVQELVEGESLDVVMRDRIARPPADALRLIAQVASALDAAAVKGLLHGALHPRDLLASDTELVRLTGVGVAQALETVAAGVPVRRPYAPPERVTGVRWDRRADVFSLAALAHELLWARRVVGVGEQAANALDDVRGGDLTALRRVFAQALAPSPGDRFETAGAFAATLSECFDAVGHAAIRAAAPRRQPRSEPKAAPTPPTPRTPSVPFESRLPLDLGDSSPAPKIVDLDHRAPPMESPADLPALSAFPEAADTPVAPLSRRVIRESHIDPPLAPVRLDVPAAEAQEPSLGRRHRRPDRAAPQPPMPELPLPLAEIEEPPQRSGFRALALTAMVFLALGFAGGYWVASHNPAVVASAPSPDPPPAELSGPPPNDVALPPAVVADSTQPLSSPAASASTTQIRPAPAPDPPPAVVETVPDAAAPPRATTPAQGAPPRPAANTPGVLVVDSRPPGANVYVDGQLRGQTPLTVPNVTPGEHGVRLQLDGYDEWIDAVRVAAGSKQRVAASLEPR